MIETTISVPKNSQLLALFLTEEQTFKHKRATYTIQEGDTLTINIKAQDATALKATVASICRVLAVYEKAK